MIRFYDRGLVWVLAHQRTTLAATIGTALLTVGLTMWIPKGFFPQQDTGLVIGVTEKTKRLFEDASDIPLLKLVKTRPFDSGIVVLSYQPDRTA